MHIYLLWVNIFELNHAYISFVGQHPFHGLPHEYPVIHIESFEDISCFQFNGVSENYYFCKLFLYSLAGRLAEGDDV